MEMNGTFATRALPERVHALVTSPEAVTRMLPGVEACSTEGDVTAVKFRLDLERMGVAGSNGYLSTATAAMKFHYEKVGNGSVVIKGSGRTLGSALRITVSLNYKWEASSTRVSWSASVETGILLKVVGEETVDAVSNEIVREIISNVERELA